MGNTMDQIKVRYGKDGKLVSIQEFLKTKNLSGLTQKIQESLKTLYQLNETEQPLFHFPEFSEDKPLTIDCITAKKTEDLGKAAYQPKQHTVIFSKDIHDNRPMNQSLAEILAHELTHAEQDTDELNKVAQENKYRAHQIGFLKEAQAYAKQQKVHYLLSNTQEAAQALSIMSTPLGETVFIKRLLEQPYLRNSYMNYFANNLPIHEGDKPLKTIPKAFNLDNADRILLPVLAQIPIRIDERPISYCETHPNEVYDYFFDNKNDDKSRFTCAVRLLDATISNQEASPDNLTKDLTRIRFLLSLKKKDGTAMFEEETLMGLINERCTKRGIKSKVFINAENAVDENGKKVFPDNFSEKVKGMSISEFSNYINYLPKIKNQNAAISPAVLLALRSQPQSSLEQRLAKGSSDNNISQIGIAKSQHQVGG